MALPGCLQGGSAGARSRSCRPRAQRVAPIAPAAAPLAYGRRFRGPQPAAVALARGVGEVAEQRRERAAAEPAQQPAARPAASANGKRAAEDDRPANLRNIVFVSSEAAPWSKTGGLGDVVGSLPGALAARGHRVMVVVPRYAEYEDTHDTGVTVELLGHSEVGYFHRRHKGVDWVFVDHVSYKRPNLYADELGPYGDNQFRFTLLCLAACEAPLHLPLPPAEGGEPTLYGEDITFLANDWHGSLVPVYLAAKYRPHGVYTNARSVLAIHNPHQRQGSYAEEGRSVNHLKAGIATADRLLTVSPGYSTEITTYLGGWGLEGLLGARQPVLSGIVNGIDEDEWDPSTDVHLARNYSLADFKAGKAANKAALQKELGLPVDPDVPLLCFIGRLDFQKGADLVLQVAPWLMSQGVQLICLGTGTPDLESGLRWLESSFPEQARGWVGFNVAMSHKMTAAADVLLMPSRFEPCGLNQLYAMRYGAVPVAHKTGGLRDTVIDFDPFAQPPVGTGWTFSNFEAGGLMHAIGTALTTLKKHPGDFEGIQRRGMARDSSWNGAAREYEQVFDWMHMDPPYCR
ncbi:soluble starch synthase chloroplastic [Raphidocelis subcapitata]|uniref:Starch synthase, chloroplastic/amyloplastic n=1 Tax=Raphidocelis subcapitata TaxID=307507 RepID=A0A2V0PNT7_9CHLO|nr:soluble starch synthase chloroplastic [Raphidocelis subcapitata]|eukprot:GBF98815.1 soluble starch synthase chloroplastic [Raphidocelis subcapitata]